MKNIGVVRKIDELGRIVIPKEIRDILSIKPGDVLSFSAQDNKIVLEKYLIMDGIKEKSNHIVSSVNDLFDAKIFVADNEKFVTKGILENKKIPNEFAQILLNRGSYTSKSVERYMFDGEVLEGFFIIKSLIKDSMPIGLIMLYKRSLLEKADETFADIIKNIVENT